MSETKEKYSDIPSHVPEELIFDYNPDTAPNFEREPYKEWLKLRDYPPVFFSPATPEQRMWTPDVPGRWFITKAEYVREAYQSPDPFSSSDLGFGGDGIDAPRRFVPLSLDPPEHTKNRVLIAPLFSPKNIDRLEEQVRDITNELLDDFIKKGEGDFMHDFARVFPGIVFMILMGLPLEQKEQFLDWEDRFFHPQSAEEHFEVQAKIFHYLRDLIAEKRKNPADDLVSLLIDAKVDGESLPQADIEDFCFLLYAAGLDTVNAGLGHIFKFLAEHPEVQKELRADPDKIHGFVEEMLRMHAWVNTGRKLVSDIDFHGVKMKKGDSVTLNAFLASRDPDEYDDPDSADITREPNPHFAFGAGPHRCAGSHLARRELRVAVREWVNRIPEFTTVPDKPPLYHVGGAMLALRSLPLTWDSNKAE